jgi:mRNA deadenylase 3'-5' endonuclease subunit Ccr4
MIRNTFLALTLYLLCSLPVRAEDSANLTVLSFNILGDDNIQYGQYDQLPGEVIDWELRKVRLYKKILSLGPDIIFLQEVNTNACAYFKEKLTKFHFNGVCSNNLATFYRKGKLKLNARSDSININNNRAQEIEVTSVDTNQIFRLINLHVKWDDRPAHQHQGCEQIKHIVSELNHNIQNQKDMPTILAGDFNLESEHQCLKTLYAQYEDSHSNYRTDTFYGALPSKRIDYIFHSKSIRSIPIKLFSKRSHTTQLPTIEEPSDHIPIVIKLRLRG